MFLCVRKNRCRVRFGGSKFVPAGFLWTRIWGLENRTWGGQGGWKFVFRVSSRVRAAENRTSRVVWDRCWKLVLGRSSRGLENRTWDCARCLKILSVFLCIRKNRYRVRFGGSKFVPTGFLWSRIWGLDIRISVVVSNRGVENRF